MKTEEKESGDVFGHITISGGTVGAIGGRGHQIQQSVPPEHQGAEAPADPGASLAPVSDLAVVPGTLRALLLDAFTAADLRRLFEFNTHPELKEVAHEFGEGDGVADMADKVIAFCRTRDLLPDLLAEVARARPRVYARYRERVEGGDG
ncbi:MAG: hypothetical protein JXA93_02895 [Anaerolineae bacterium]|nr:hypothetical protein [Anaerolineae bacterium]